jgi:Na+/H+ antiporter NhaC
VSREKLAYIVDSTAAPVASLALISTWIGIEIGYLNDQMTLLSPFAASGYGVFLRMIPFRMYCIFTLMMVTLIAITGRDFGPMLSAERLARIRLDTDRGSGTRTSSYLAAVLPVFVVLVTTMGAFLVVGARHLHRPIAIFSPGFWRDAFVAVEDSSLWLAVASLAGFLTAVCAAVCGRVLTTRQTATASLKAMKTMLPALGLLVLAQALRKVTDGDHLRTADFLIDLLSNVNLNLIPLSVFLVAALVAFATGTSWGTMGILIPVAVPLAATAVTRVHGDPTLILLATAAVLDGAVFGDHCSPISDTTVMSSIGSSCDHLSHVRTQIPYAFTAMGVAAVVGYLGYPFLGLKTAWVLIIGALVLTAVVFVFGRRTWTEQPNVTS